MYSKDISDTELADMIPATMGTQHPDNSKVVPFGDDLIKPRTSKKVPFNLEPLEVHYNFQSLSAAEVMIDFEGKMGHPAPLPSVIDQDPEFYQKNPIGKSFLITPRIPNPRKSGTDPIFQQSFGPFVNSVIFNIQRLCQMGQPILEFVMPQVESGEVIARLERRLVEHFDRYKDEYGEDFPGEDFPYKGDFYVWGIPLIEDVEHLADPRKIWDEMVEKRKEYTGKDTYVIRTFDARSDPALQAGMFSAILAVMLSMSRGITYEREKGIRVLHILGAGSPPFRGGFTPYSIEDYLDTYPGISTTTIQSAFRYDWPQTVVRRAVKRVHEMVPDRWLKRHELVTEFSEEEAKELYRIIEMARDRYHKSVAELGEVALKVADKMPSHRDRSKFKGTGSYGRQLMGMSFPRAIKYTGSFTSLGMPPGLLGLGIYKDFSDDQRKLIEKANPMLPRWIGKSLLLLNVDNLNRLERDRSLKHVMEDVEVARDTGEKLPMDTMHYNHISITTEILDRLLSGEDFTDSIGEASEERRYLG